MLGVTPSEISPAAAAFRSFVATVPMTTLAPRRHPDRLRARKLPDFNGDSFTEVRPLRKLVFNGAPMLVDDAQTPG